LAKKEKISYHREHKEHREKINRTL